MNYIIYNNSISYFLMNSFFFYNFFTLKSCHDDLYSKHQFSFNNPKLETQFEIERRSCGQIITNLKNDQNQSSCDFALHTALTD